ncbi:MAG: RMD1 family protein [Erysipelotrichaceae bacterium]|nr:RMD1 family protein [Erysipelotrichaceae bacterium]
MDNMKFNTFAVAKEIDLNRIAVACGIRKKYTWEEPLIIKDDLLEKIVGDKTDEGEIIYIYSFGSIVFINSTLKHTELFMGYLKKLQPSIIESYTSFEESYALQIGENAGIELTDRYVKVPEMELYYPELISIVIAKSTALERVEEHLEKIFDKLELKIDNLEKGQLRIGNRELARITSSIIRHEYNSIAYIMILDKPDIAWSNSEAGMFYDKLSDFFELNDRYEVIRSKTEILRNIVAGLASVSQSIRGLFVEWVIVVLIVVELVFMIVELLR